MSAPQTLDRSTLSQSVQRVVDQHADGEPIPAARMVNDLFALHPEYGNHLAGKVQLDEAQAGDRRPAEGWISLAREAYPEHLPLLDGKLTVMGLAIGSEEVAAGLLPSGILPAIGREVEHERRAPLDKVLAADAFQRWTRIHSLAPGGAKHPSASPEPAPHGAEGAASLQTALLALADSPTARDQGLHFADYADALAEFIESPKTRTPLTIAIDAAWGMGKTSLMYMVRERLDPDAPGIGDAPPRRVRGTAFSRFRTVWFNAWKYDQEEALWAALALEILTQTRKRSSLPARARIWAALNLARFDWRSFLQDLAGSLVRPALLVLVGALLYLSGVWALDPAAMREHLPVAARFGTVAAALTGLYGVGKTLYEYLTTPFDLDIARYLRTPRYEEKIGFLSEFEEDFRRVVRVATQGGKWPLVVFVDDLDRCAPTKAVEVIEAINTVLDTEHCIFIIGMDGDAVSASIETKYSELKEHLHHDPGGLTLGERFLEKIVQVSFRIPRAERTLVEAFIGEVLRGEGARGAAPEVEREVREAEHLIRAEQRAGRALPEAAKDVRTHLKGDVMEGAVREAAARIEARSAAEAEQVRVAVVEAAPYLDFNPRKIKRFINTFRLQALIARKRGMLTGEAEVRLLARAVTIATRWPELVDALLPDRAFVDKLEEAHRLQRQLLELQALPEKQEAKERPIQAKLAGCLANPRLRRLMEAGELIGLLETMGEPDRQMLVRYLSLARATTGMGAA